MDAKRISMAVCLFVAACRGQDGPAPDSGLTYTEMNFEQRYAFMTDIVLPQMTQTFVEFDAKYARMTCATCHGNGAADGSFAMPTKEIAVLPGTEEGFLEYAKDPEVARWSQFMFEKVVPKIAGLLQVDRYDPITHTGEFSCHNCHTLDGVGH
jgi:hypothetical protein